MRFYFSTVTCSDTVGIATKNGKGFTQTVWLMSQMLCSGARCDLKRRNRVDKIIV